MLRRPPRSTLFPYRRSSDLAGRRGAVLVTTGRGGELQGRDRVVGLGAVGLGLVGPLDDLTARVALGGGEGQLVGVLGEHRSEEHTSELQSRRDLVCRLLLEK